MVRERESFSELLARLQEYHERALAKLQKDNVRLSQEIYRLQGWLCEPEDSDSQSEEEMHTFPTLIPGMPADLVRPSKYPDHPPSPHPSERKPRRSGHKRPGESPVPSVTSIVPAPLPTSSSWDCLPRGRSAETELGGAAAPSRWFGWGRRGSDLSKGSAGSIAPVSMVPGAVASKGRQRRGSESSVGSRASRASRASHASHASSAAPVRIGTNQSLNSAKMSHGRNDTSLACRVERSTTSADSFRRTEGMGSPMSSPKGGRTGLGLPIKLCEEAPAVAREPSDRAEAGLPKKLKRRPSVTSQSATSALSRKGSLDSIVANLENQNFSKQKQRFRQLLELKGDFVTPSCLLKALQKRGRADYSIDEAERAIQDLCEIEQHGMEGSRPVMRPSPSSSIGIELESFVQLMVDSEWQCEPETYPAVHEIRTILLPQAVQEVIERAARPGHMGSSDKLGGVCSQVHQFPPHRKRQMTVLNAVVGMAVVTSIVTLGVSMDLAPSWTGWIMMEAVFTVIFVAEVVIKCSVFGPRGYFLGHACKWNWFDFVVTLMSLVDVSLSLMQDSENSFAVHFAVMLRAFRVARIARLVKLLHTPLLAELANMLAGFQVGLPCLLWVMVLLFIVFYVVGTALRHMAGPDGNSPIAMCGVTGDSVTEIADPACQPHLLYGEEFFGTLRTSIFTVFRCVLGDCSTQAGKSLTAIFSHGYGVAFDLTYCCLMVLIIVGLFNIIAAIFVETTISGLKYNNVQRKYARMYESRYVQQRLEALVTRMQELLPQLHEREFALNEDEFDEVMQDEGVNGILEDLDVALSNRVGLFDMFDCDNDGTVNISDLLATLMKIRGEPQKSDMIASWVALRSLNERFQEFEWLVLENQKRILERCGGMTDDS